MDEYWDNWEEEEQEECFWNSRTKEAFEFLHGTIHADSSKWQIYDPQKSEASEWSDILKNGSIEHYEDFEDEEYGKVEFTTLVTEHGKKLVQIPRHFLEQIVDVESTVKLSQVEIQRLTEVIEKSLKEW